MWGTHWECCSDKFVGLVLDNCVESILTYICHLGVILYVRIYGDRTAAGVSGRCKTCIDVYIYINVYKSVCMYILMAV